MSQGKLFSLLQNETKKKKEITGIKICFVSFVTFFFVFLLFAFIPFFPFCCFSFAFISFFTFCFLFSFLSFLVDSFLFFLVLLAFSSFFLSNKTKKDVIPPVTGTPRSAGSNAVVETKSSVVETDTPRKSVVSDPDFWELEDKVREKKRKERNEKKTLPRRVWKKEERRKKEKKIFFLVAPSFSNKGKEEIGWN